MKVTYGKYFLKVSDCPVSVKKNQLLKSWQSCAFFLGLQDNLCFYVQAFFSLGISMYVYFLTIKGFQKTRNTVLDCSEFFHIQKNFAP